MNDSATGMTEVYKRRPGAVFRVIDGKAWIGWQGHSTIGVEGLSLLVWLALDDDLSACEIAETVTSTWPEVGEIKPEQITEVLDALVEFEVVVCAVAPVESAESK